MRPWQTVFPEFDRAVYAKAGFMARQPFGERPALLIIDVVESFTGTRRENVLDSIDEYRTSCGDQAWPALEAIQQLLRACRAGGLPVVYTKGDPVDKYFCGDSVKGTDPAEVARLYGAPIAQTNCPTRSASLSPNRIGFRFSASTFRTAMSVLSSIPTTRAG